MEKLAVWSTAPTMARRPANVACRASYRDFILVTFAGRSFSTATPGAKLTSGLLESCPSSIKPKPSTTPFDTGLGIPRTECIVMVQVTTRPRSPFEKRNFYELLCKELLQRCAVKASDVVVSITQNADEDWSFRYGRAQFITGEL